MFTIDSPHWLALLCAFPLTLFLWASFWGWAKNHYTLFLIVAIFPVLLAFISVFIPQFIVIPLMFIFYFGGFGLFLFNIRKKISFSFWKDFSKWEKGSFIFLLVLLTSKFISATYFRDEGTVIDATTYHMGAPKEWATYMQGPFFNTNNPVTLTSSYFEYFNYSYLLLFKGAMAYLSKLAPTYYEFMMYVLLLVGQMFTAVFGLVLIPLLIYKTFEKERLFAFTLIAGFFSLGTFTWVWPLAKNNAYSVLVAIFAYYLLVFRKNSLLIGGMLGIAVGAKFTNGYVIPFVFLAVLYTHWKKISINWWQLVLGGFLGLGVVMFRNILETGNPIFPIDFLMKNPMIHPDFEKTHYLYSHPSTWEVVGKKMHELYISNYALLLFSLISLAFRQFLYPVLFLGVALLNAKMTGVLSGWPHKATIMVLLLPWAYAIYQKMKALKFDYTPQLIKVTAGVFMLLAPISFENFLKRPFQRYGLTLDETLNKTAYYWAQIKKDNQEHYADECFVVKDRYGGYFSRYPFIKVGEANPAYEYDYCKKVKLN